MKGEETEGTNSESIINQITLDCLLNKAQYEKYIQRNTKKSINNNDKKFYRKRICNMTKELLKEDGELIPPDLKYVFDNYIKLCVNYFKVLDRSDTIQEDYKEISDTVESTCVTNQEIAQSNSLLMRSVKVDTGLDNFVTVKIMKKQEELIMPQQRNINLRDPKFKKKGITEREKKNITIKYDDQEEKKQEELDWGEKEIEIKTKKDQQAEMQPKTER